MKFTLTTKPLKDALQLVIINGNISKFFEKSTVLQISVDGDTLILNTEATSLLSEARLKGSNSSGERGMAIVDNVLFKNLIGTIDTSEVSLEFDDNAVIVESGKSQFSVPKIFGEDDGVSIDKPADEESVQSGLCGEVRPAIWKYIQTHQMYAIATSIMHRVYMRAWADKDRGVLTGNPETSIFTYQPQSDMQDCCLLTQTVVNLLSSLDDATKLYRKDETHYVADMDTDSIRFRAEFSVDEESEDGIGVYDADMIFEMIFDESQEEVSIKKSKLLSAIKQASLFTTASDSFITVESGASGVKIKNGSADCLISSGSFSSYSVEFSMSDFSSVIGHMDGDDISISPIVKDDEVFGLRFSSGKLVALLGSID